MKMNLTIEYKNGNKITNTINYLHFENGKICFTVDKQMHGLFDGIVSINLDNVNKFDLEKIGG